jgi:hypothetical protein
LIGRNLPLVPPLIESTLYAYSMQPAYAIPERLLGISLVPYMKKDKLLKVALIPPPPKYWIFPVFHEKEPLLFLRWVVLVRHFLLLGILVRDSFVEKAPNVRSIVNYVRKTCYTWK